MPLQADETYEMVCADAKVTQSREKGTPGLYLKFACSLGSVDRTFWLTPDTIEHVERSLTNMGIEERLLKRTEFWVDPGPKHYLVGKAAKIVTEEQEYNDRPFLTIKWINASGAPPATEDTLGRVMRLFGAAGGRQASHSGGYDPDQPVDDPRY